MLPNRLSDDPIALDFESVRQRLQALATQAFPAWTDDSTPGFGNVLLDLFAFSVELLGYAIEYQGRESRLATSNRRANVLAHARMLGYKPHGAKAARTMLHFMLDGAANDDVLIPTGYVVRTQDVTPAVKFRVVAPSRIVKGRQELRVEAESAQTHHLVVDTTGLPNQKVVLPQIPYLDGSVRVVAANGKAYTEVANFLDSTGTDPHFEISVDEEERASLLFGTGIMGATPTGRLDITYKVGGGLRSNVEADSLTVTDSPIFTASGQAASFKVTNPSAAEGGSDRESIESIRRNAPESLRVAHRTITREDFEINARKVPGVARALMLTSNEEPAIEENTGHLFIVPDAGGELTEELKARVLRQVTHDYPCTLTFQVDVRAPTYVPIDVDVDVELNHEGPRTALGYSDALSSSASLHADAEAKAKHALAEHFQITRPNGAANENVDFGFYSRGSASGRGDVAWSEIITTLCAVPEIRKVARASLNGKNGDVELEHYQFPVLGNVTIRSKVEE